MTRFSVAHRRSPSMRRRGESARAVTISDVARAVGVATSTVSRALTQPGRVSEALRQRVAAAAAELGYHANPQARSLTSGRTHSIALLIPDVDQSLFLRPDPRHAGAGESARLPPHAGRHRGIGRARGDRAGGAARLGGRHRAHRIAGSPTPSWSKRRGACRSSSSTARSRASRASWSTPRPASCRRSNIWSPSATRGPPSWPARHRRGRAAGAGRRCRRRRAASRSSASGSARPRT